MNYVSCPRGFVMPEDPGHSRVRWVGGTGCAVACKSPILTPHEHEIIDRIASISNIIGVPALLALIVTWFLNKDRRKQYIVWLTALGCFLASISCLPMISLWGESWEKRFCLDNAVTLSAGDPGGAACSAQAVIFSVSLSFAVSCWLVNAVDLYCFTVLEMKSTRHLLRYYAVFIAIFPVTLFLATLANAHYGYYPGQFYVCFPSIEGGIDMIFFFFCFTYVVIGGCLTTRSMMSLVFTGGTLSCFTAASSAAGNDNSSSPVVPRSVSYLFKRIKVPLLFTVVCFIWITILVTQRALSYFDPSLLYPDADWVSCVFANYDGVSNDSWISHCGETSKRRIPFPLIALTVLSEYGNGMFLAAIYLSSASVFKEWKQRLMASRRGNYVPSQKSSVVVAVTTTTH